MQPQQVGLRGSRDDNLHSLRGLGAGSSFGLPQLSIQALTSSHGTPMRVRLNSARRRLSSARNLRRPWAFALLAHGFKPGRQQVVVGREIGQQVGDADAARHGACLKQVGGAGIDLDFDLGVHGLHDNTAGGRGEAIHVPDLAARCSSSRRSCSSLIEGRAFDLIGHRINSIVPEAKWRPGLWR